MNYANLSTSASYQDLTLRVELVNPPGATAVLKEVPLAALAPATGAVGAVVWNTTTSAPGSYTVKLHFLESFFSPLIPAAPCRGAGCRVFDVTCNGVMLLQDFDVVQAAGEAFRPVVREFHGLRPNGQGKLLLSFWPKVNYAEVRAIEVIDEAK